MKYPECTTCGKWSPILSAIGNFTISIFKFVVGGLTGSKGLMADAVHSIADTISSVFVLIALKISGKPKDEGHPYGHGKVEYISTISASLFIFLCASLILLDALHSFKHGSHAIPSNAALVATIISLFYSWLMYTSNTCAGQQLNSPAMLADAAESKADSLTSVAVLLGLIGTKMGFIYSDTIAALVVSIFVFHISVEMFMKGVHGLIDISMDRETLEDIKHICQRVKGIEGVRAIRSRCMGQKCAVDIDIEVASTFTVLETHTMIEQVKAVILSKIDGLDSVFVRAYPIEKWRFWN
ncbi:cation diffusion facilitator family transporter [Candidatus Magnetominusculus xianensis]|uniref:Magnetosome protein MamB n=1 Tax=Candidatus Magnetominusculus xianensis TaxID=1748249 RepID=A0ABR5SKS3_9BACT|nr:cation diffusion facilitator family transporter [Candidatus Magnetominusculus xianensis]KWT94834.1 magnetosome protein MamB [Candidatus Magnetominusculus xianensis]MBF0404726.1 cation transporter [Nitrospirota bacterium]